MVGNFAFVTHAAAAEQVSILFRNGFVVLVIVFGLLFVMVDLTVVSKKNKSSKSKRKRCGSASSVTARSVKIKGGKKIDGTIPKRLKRRTLASILVEDPSRLDGMTKQYLDSEALPLQSSKYPPRKIFPVTGLLGIYTDPKVI